MNSCTFWIYGYENMGHTIFTSKGTLKNVPDGIGCRDATIMNMVDGPFYLAIQVERTREAAYGSYTVWR